MGIHNIYFVFILHYIDLWFISCYQDLFTSTSANFIPDDALDNSLRKSKSKKKPVEEQETADKQRAELELLMDDSADGNKHFDLKEIIKAEKKKRKRKKRNNEKEVDEDNFEINASDPRFAALLESHHFAIDPTNPQ